MGDMSVSYMGVTWRCETDKWGVTWGESGRPKVEVLISQDTERDHRLLQVLHRVNFEYQEITT
jgi:hypothetical protein